MDRRSNFYYVANLGSMSNAVVRVLKSMGCGIHRLVKDKNNYVVGTQVKNDMVYIKLKDINAGYYYNNYRLKITVPKNKNEDFLLIMGTIKGLKNVKYKSI